MGIMNKVFWLFGCSGAGKTTLALRLRDGLAGPRNHSGGCPALGRR